MPERQKQCQRAVITSFAKANGYVVEAEFYDATVSVADSMNKFLAVLERFVPVKRRALHRLCRITCERNRSH
jgi:hypothetical protein